MVVKVGPAEAVLSRHLAATALATGPSLGALGATHLGRGTGTVVKIVASTLQTFVALRHGAVSNTIDMPATSPSFSFTLDFANASRRWWRNSVLAAVFFGLHLFPGTERLTIGQ